jgi:[ribosomal protein S5]-alanine N-acetyltransferase
MKLFDLQAEEYLVHLREITPADQKFITQWPKPDRLEEHTCRPIVDGQRVASSSEVRALVCFIDEVDVPVGRFTFFDLNSRNRSAEFGYIINPAYRKRGVGTRMVTAGVSYLFSELDLNKVYCQTASFNAASIKLLERLHFHRDAVLREHHELDGELWDDYIYSYLRAEWLRRKPKFPD